METALVLHTKNIQSHVILNNRDYKQWGTILSKSDQSLELKKTSARTLVKEVQVPSEHPEFKVLGANIKRN